MDQVDKLLSSITNNDIKSVKELVSTGAPIHVAPGDWDAVHYAIEDEHYDIVEYLISAGANLETINCGMTCLAHAVDISIDGSQQAGKSDAEAPTDIIELLLRHGADPAPGIAHADSYNCPHIIDFIKQHSVF